MSAVMAAVLTAVESELRVLNTVSRESCERTTAALERVQETLRVFLERDQKDRSNGAPRKRAGIHNPISHGSHPYAIGEDFGSEPERNPGSTRLRCARPRLPIRTFWMRSRGKRKSCRLEEFRLRQTRRGSTGTFRAGCGRPGVSRRGEVSSAFRAWNRGRCPSDRKRRALLPAYEGPASSFPLDRAA